MEEKKRSLKLVIPETDLKDFSKFKNLRLNTNGKKPRGKNLYKRQLSRVRRMFR